MIRRVLFELDRIEVYVPAWQNLVFGILVECALGIAFYFVATRIQDSGRYVFLIVLSIFLLAIASGMLPAINQLRRGNRNLIWAATRVGIELPSRTTTFTAMRPPEVTAWPDIASLLLADKLKIAESDGTTTTWNVLIVTLLPTAKQTHRLLSNWHKPHRNSSGGNYALLYIPKAHKSEVVGRLRMLAPAQVKIEHLAKHNLPGT
jgi:hypothetical protein